jgi:hypothetical protein
MLFLGEEQEANGWLFGTNTPGAGSENNEEFDCKPCIKVVGMW